MRRSRISPPRQAEVSRVWNIKVATRGTIEGLRPSLVPPLNRAADARGLLCRPQPGTRDLDHRIEELARSVGFGGAPGVVDAASVLQAQSSIEAKEIRRAHRAVIARRLLALVPQVWKRKAQVRGERLHVVERVLRVVGGVVAADRHRADAAAGEF